MTKALSKPPGERQIKGKQRQAVDLMVWSGKSRNDAADAVGMGRKSLYIALRDVAVLGYYREQLKVLRESEQSRSIARLAEIRDTSTNHTAAVAAAKLLMDNGNPDEHSGASGRVPGITIVVESTASERHIRVIDEKPSDISGGHLLPE